MSGDHSNNFDNNTLALLNRIANNRRTNLAPEAILQQPARASRGGDSATRSKQHALFGDGGTRALQTSIDLQVLGYLMTVADGAVIDDSAF